MAAVGGTDGSTQVTVKLQTANNPLPPFATIYYLYLLV